MHPHTVARTVLFFLRFFLFFSTVTRYVCVFAAVCVCVCLCVFMCNKSRMLHRMRIFLFCPPSSFLFFLFRAMHNSTYTHTRVSHTYMCACTSLSSFARTCTHARTLSSVSSPLFSHNHLHRADFLWLFLFFFPLFLLFFLFVRLFSEDPI